MSSKADDIREKAEGDLETFIRLVHPHRALGAIHQNLITWRNRAEAKSHQLILLPRDHGKSAIFGGYLVAWEITRNPAIRILYISSTSTLAVKQLKFIKDILTSPIYRRYWPEMVNVEDARREKWTETEVSVDHPRRKEEYIRDPTVFTAGLTTNIVGMHADLLVLDDTVTNDTAYTEEGRKRLETQYSFLASIEGTKGRQIVIGTRYHPKDLYETLKDTVIEYLNDDGEIVRREPLYEVRQHEVEDRGDGTGEFLWPVQTNNKGQTFGFNRDILARKKAQYLDPVQFRAQYYNDPNDTTNASIKREYFQYYDKSFLSRSAGQWYFKGNRLNLFASIDFAFSLGQKSDFTTIVVIGVDSFQNIYVLDIDRFKTDMIVEYFRHILHLHQKWDFRKLRAEISVAQDVIVKDLKQNYIRVHGLALAVEDYRPHRNEGTKKERVLATLQPRYSNRQVWHYQGGNCQTLEEELILDNPPHDDIKDCLASVVDTAIAPSFRRFTPFTRPGGTPEMFHNRFGGVQ